MTLRTAWPGPLTFALVGAVFALSPAAPLAVVPWAAALAAVFALAVNRTFLPHVSRLRVLLAQLAGAILSAEALKDAFAGRLSDVTIVLVVVLWVIGVTRFGNRSGASE